MTAKQFAKQMMRWIQPSGEPAANAPAFLRKALSPYQTPIKRRLVAASFDSIAAGDQITYPAREVLVQWLMDTPALDQAITVLLTSKEIPKSARELYQRLWRKELIAVREDIKQALVAELARYA